MNTSSGGSAANGRPRRKAALKADKNRKDADAATAAAAKAAESSDDDAAAAKAAESSDDDAAAAEESDDDVFADESDADDDEPAPKAGSKRKASSGKAGSKRKASSGKAGSKRKASYFSRKAEAEAKYPPQEESRKKVEPSSKTLEHLEAAGSEFVGGHGEVLDELISNNDLTVIPLSWDDLASAKEVDDTMKLFWKVCFTEPNKGRSALSTGGPRLNWRVKQLLDEPRFSIIKQRLEEVAEACKCKINQVFAMFYCEVEEEKRRCTTKSFDGGADFHGDFFPDPQSNSRFLDTFGTPKEGKKTMSFKEVKTGKVATISVPHGTVILMSSLAAGNDFGEYQHAVEGAWGTGFFSVDMSWIGA